ncbi:hypothetical protein BV898_16563 [Hypsibius exemplaris]|uniref:G-protein coupled receptors family 1 profile domain-containing protein n=1 Tax=Hypsibius exemplaris TaxID=2072580 RepID=A0A9X6RLY5_HYPEX|nr:hypothetical protein BV898_16563 [Hypsibius exemplaris]
MAANNSTSLFNLGNLSSNAAKEPNRLVQAFTWFTIFTIIATIAGNGLIILAYITQRQLRTPFNLYIFYIAFLEALLAVTAMPGSFIQSFYGYWPFDAVSCSFVITARLVVGAAVRWGHTLIPANRIWAVTFPVHYRVAHTMRCATWLVVGSWIFLCAVCLPMVVLGRKSMGSAASDVKCQRDNDGLYAEIIGFDLPEIIIVLAFPYICFKLRRYRRLKRQNKVLAHQSAVSDTMAMEKKATRSSLPPSAADPISPDPLGTAQPRSSPPQPRSGQSRSHFRIQTYLVIGIIICWTPNTVFWLLVDTTHPRYWNPTFNAVQFFLQYTYAWVSPLLCIAANRSIRQGVCDVLRCQRT